MTTFLVKSPGPDARWKPLTVHAARLVFSTIDTHRDKWEGFSFCAVKLDGKAVGELCEQLGVQTIDVEDDAEDDGDEDGEEREAA